jgi:hypothetical protein
MFAGRDNLKGHVNASTDHPSWAEIESLLEQEQGETSDDQGDDQAEPGDDRDPESRDDQTPDQADGPSERDEKEEDDVPTEEELQKQRQQAGSDQGESGDGRDPETTDDQEEGSPSRTATAGLVPAVPGLSALEDLDTTTLALLGALLVVVVVAWYYLGESRDSAGPSGTPSGGREAGRRDDVQEDSDDEDDEHTLIE